MSHSLLPQELYSPWNSPGHNTRVGSFFLLQGIFPTQGSNPGLTHCRQILYQLSHKGSPLFCYIVRLLSLLLLAVLSCFVFIELTVFYLLHILALSIGPPSPPSDYNDSKAICLSFWQSPILNAPLTLGSKFPRGLGRCHQFSRVRKKQSYSAENTYFLIRFC